ncbi:MAG TPA: type II toxin-antitoxin system VapC family toxin [Pyrinomonadaceae bacterium]|nr:type II toxin-antitoxin system VapC family toxin [Pyrinomonadaceae bacterium]
MRLLLDTHAFLWFIMGSANLSVNARALIENPANERQLSVVCLWEIAIKTSLGKLTLSAPFDELIPAQLMLNGIDVLNIKVDHLSTLTSLPFHHRDPFDRLIIAQAIVEKLPVISLDGVFDTYGVTRHW